MVFTMFEIKRYTLKENLISVGIGAVLGILLALCNPNIRKEIFISEETVSVPMVNVVHKETPPNTEIKILQKEISCNDVTEEDIAEEIKFGEMELVAQLVQAEAGNQDLMGKRLVVDVVLNRVDDERFPNTVEEVIFQKDPVQFSVTANGAFEKAGWNIDEETYQAVLMEYEERTNSGILYFSTTPCNGKNHFQHGDHWFGY